MTIPRTRPADPDRGPRPRRTAHRGGAVLAYGMASVGLLLSLWFSVASPQEAPAGAIRDVLAEVSTVGGPGDGVDDGSGDLDEADGYVGRGASLSLSDTHLPAIAELDPALLRAVRRAADDAADDGVELRVTSGWRSHAYQQHLLDEAIATHGRDAAARLVHPPERSKHVSGEAVDIGPTDAAYWLVDHGSDYGLCQVYANEIWHFELLTTPGGTCPELRPDAFS